VRLRDARDQLLGRDALGLGLQHDRRAVGVVGADEVDLVALARRWKRTQMSAWTYSMMWPMWNGPLAYGSAVVTKSLRGM
jgi:hypothetical protein